MILHTDVVSLGITRAMKAKERISEISDPADEQSNHQPVNVYDQSVHALTMFRSHDRQFKNFLHRQICQLEISSRYKQKNYRRRRAPSPPRSAVPRFPRPIPSIDRSPDHHNKPSTPAQRPGWRSSRDQVSAE